MITKDDEVKIRKIINEEVELSADSMRSSLVSIESKIGILSDIWEFIKDHTVQLKDHEERITNLESQPKT